MKHRTTLPSPPHGLVRLGPIVPVILGLHPSIVAAQGGATQIAPQAAARMMIDTGASCTLIDRDIASSLGVSPTTFTSIVGVSGIAEMYPVYPLSIILGFEDGSGSRGQLAFATNVVGMPTVANGQHDGLLGRDFLAHFEVFYNGPGGYLEIRMPAQLKAQVVPSSAPPRQSNPPRQQREKARNARKARRKNR